MFQVQCQVGKRTICPIYLFPFCSPTFLSGVSHRLRQLRQSRVGTGSHPGHERLPDRHEAAEGAAEALQERQQTVLILALGSICSPC